MARDRDSVMNLLSLLPPRNNPDDIMRLFAVRVLNRFASHFGHEDERVVARMVEVYAGVLGHFGVQQSAEALVETLQGLTLLAKRKDSSVQGACRWHLRKWKTLEWMDSDGFFHSDAQVRLWTLRALEALGQVREPPSQGAIDKAQAANAAAAAAAAADAAADGLSVVAAAPIAAVTPAEGASYIGPEVAKLPNLLGGLVSGVLQVWDEHDVPLVDLLRSCVVEAGASLAGASRLLVT